jgi:diguanylate cyclase (GGDEF)-like protein
MTARHVVRAVLVLACTLAAACASIVAIGELQADATASRDAEQQLAALRLELAQIQDVPWGASPDEGDDPDAVREELKGAEEHIEATLAGLDLTDRRAILDPFERSAAALWKILDLVSSDRLDDTWAVSSTAAREAAVADGELRAAAARFRERSVDALRQSRTGMAVVILLLFGAFAWCYALARRSVAENRRLLAASREEALTDALTGLRNRRALVADLAAQCPAPGEPPVLLALFDLDGFKAYNDTFGHPAGDALLARLGGRLAAAVGDAGVAYRMGGDEFCVLAPVRDEDPAAVVLRAARALADEGDGYAIGASHGSAVLPADGSTPAAALRRADQRMYAHKAEVTVRHG